MHARLVVGFDGSESSVAALRWAAAEAQGRHASVSVVCSYAMPPFLDFYGLGLRGGPSDADIAQATAEGVCGAVASASAAHPGVAFERVVVDEPPVDVLVRRAAEADLLVVGSNGMGARRGLLLGTVVSGVLSKSTCPVVVVPAKLPGPCGRVVVGVDGSAGAEEASRWATDEADRLGFELVVLHAWAYPYAFTNDGFGRGPAVVAVDAAIVVEHTVAMARHRGSGSVVERLVEGGAVQALLDAAERADLVVVGSRGRGGFRTMLFGSVAQNVAAHAVCPVVVVPPPR